MLLGLLGDLVPNKDQETHQKSAERAPLTLLGRGNRGLSVLDGFLGGLGDFHFRRSGGDRVASLDRSLRRSLSDRGGRSNLSGRGLSDRSSDRSSDRGLSDRSSGSSFFGKSNTHNKNQSGQDSVHDTSLGKLPYPKV